MKLLKKINTGRYYYNSDYNYPLRLQENQYAIRTNIPDGKCQLCGIIIGHHACYCVKCANLLQRKVKQRPTKEELQFLLKSTNGNFSLIGKYFSVSDNAIRKWCKSYGISHKTANYKNFKKIGQYNLEGNLIQFFNTYAEASRSVCGNVKGETSIAAVCKGTRKTAYGYIWKHEQ